MYSMWTVQQLKAALKNRGASLRGLKADLVNRLELFDKNSNFGVPQQHDFSDKKMDLSPPHESYHDGNSGTRLPSLRKYHIQLYFNEFEKKPDVGLQLYEARFLIVVRAYSVVNKYIFIMDSL